MVLVPALRAWQMQASWSSARALLADVPEADDAYIIRIDPQDRELAVTGEADRRRPAAPQHAPTGRFEYRTVLPGDVQADRVSAQLSDGVLRPAVPKSEPAKSRHIERRRSGRVGLALLAVASIAVSWLSGHAIFTRRCTLLYCRPPVGGVDFSQP